MEKRRRVGRKGGKEGGERGGGRSLLGNDARQMSVGNSASSLSASFSLLFFRLFFLLFFFSSPRPLFLSFSFFFCLCFSPLFLLHTFCSLFISPSSPSLSHLSFHLLSSPFLPSTPPTLPLPLPSPLSSFHSFPITILSSLFLKKPRRRKPIIHISQKATKDRKGM